MAITQKCRGCGQMLPVCCGSGTAEDEWSRNYCANCCPNKSDHCPPIVLRASCQEPEHVIHWLCPVGILNEAVPMVLTQRLDDSAGRQRRYVCPKCDMEITVEFPPASQ
jgi:hypothetical protein